MADTDRRSALERHYDQGRFGAAGPDEAALVLSEQRGLAMAQVNGAPTDVGPAALGSVVDGDVTLLWTGPGQWFAVSASLGPEALLAKLGERLSSSDATIRPQPCPHRAAGQRPRLEGPPRQRLSRRHRRHGARRLRRQPARSFHGRYPLHRRRQRRCVRIPEFRGESVGVAAGRRSRVWLYRRVIISAGRPVLLMCHRPAGIMRAEGSEQKPIPDN